MHGKGVSRSPARHRATPGRAARVCVWAVALAAFTMAARTVPARAAPVWTRLELVENTAEGPAFDRCQIEVTLEKGLLSVAIGIAAHRGIKTRRVVTMAEVLPAGW